MLLAEPSQLLVDKVLAADDFLVADAGVLHVAAKAGLAGVMQQAVSAFTSARLLLFGAGCAGAAGDSAAALVDFECVAHAEL